MRMFLNMVRPLGEMSERVHRKLMGVFLRDGFVTCCETSSKYHEFN
jgi:hypothetical protein